MRYRKKPVVVEAVQWLGDNQKEIRQFCPLALFEVQSDPAANVSRVLLKVPTLEGDHYASKGDYIIKGIQGEFYPCRPRIFKQTYEPVEE